MTQREERSSPVSLPPDRHLDHLLEKERRRSILSSIAGNLRDFLQPTKFEPNEFASLPADPGTMLLRVPRDERFLNSQALSLLVNFSLVAGLMWLGSTRTVQNNLRNVVRENHIFAPSLQMREIAQQNGGGGGGGGQQSAQPVAHGEVPISHRALLMPPAQRPDHPVELPVESGLDLPLPQHDVLQVGDPMSKLTGKGLGPGKNGIGGPGDRGHGPDTGPGSGVGPEGTDGGPRGFGGASRPIAIYQPQPEYSEEARKARFQGVVRLMVTVGEDGVPRDIHVTRSLGLGLDEKAIEAVARWRFKPAMKDGRAVATRANIEVGFRLF